MPNQLIFSPGVDMITDTVAVVMQDRPVVGMSAWLTDALTSAKVENRDVQLVTSPDTKLTWPVRSMLFKGTNSRWIVTTDKGESFCGLSGTRMKWNGELFIAQSKLKPGQQNSDIHPDWVVQDKASVAAHLQLTIRVRHQPAENTVLGRMAELLFTKLTGSGPAGWATSEPVTQPWSPTQLTDYCKDRMPEPTWLVLAGQPGPEFRPATGTLEVRRTRSGLDETVTMAVAQPGLDFPKLTELGALVDAVADNHELISATLIGSHGAPDAMYQPRFSGVACPIGMGIGNEAVRASSLKELLDLPGVNAQAIGPSHAPAIWYPLGSGKKPEDWQHYSKLIQKLSPVQAAVEAAKGRD